MTRAGANAVRGPGTSVPWREVGFGLVLSLAGTALAGGALVLLQGNVWWLALAGVLALVGGGAFVGWRRGEGEPLYGALLAVLYYGVVVAVLFVGTLTDWLPDPLPGLAIGDSTFFFVWPLLQLVGAVAGAVVGGRILGRGPGR